MSSFHADGAESAVRRLTGSVNDYEQGIDARARVNGVTYVVLVGGKDDRGAMVRLAEFREWHRV